MGQTTGECHDMVKTRLMYELSRIADTSGVKYFDILPTDLMDDSMKLVDTKGKEIAFFRKERFGPGKRAHILVKNNGEELKIDNII